MLREIKNHAFHLKVHDLGAGDITQLVEHLPGIQRLYSRTTEKPRVHACSPNPSHPEAKSETQGQSEFEASLGYTKVENVHILPVDL